MRATSPPDRGLPRVVTPLKRGGPGAVPGSRRRQTLASEVRALVAALPASHAGYRTRLSVRLGKRTFFVLVADIDWIEADGNYVRLHTTEPSGSAHLIRIGIGELARELDPATFVRVHRSAIVRRDHIAELRQLPNGEYEAVLRSRQAVPVGARYRQLLD